LAHEHFHTWNPLQLGGFDRERPVLGYWFSEGFTDFYARRLLVRSGLLTPQAFADVWNYTLLGYDGSPLNRTPNRDLTEWGPNSSLPYLRGALLAAVWDQRLRDASSGQINLDSVVKRVRALEAARPGASTATALFRQAMAESGLDVSGDLERYIEKGELISLPSDVFGPCVRIVSRVQPTFDRGFDAEATEAAAMKLTGVREDGPAYAAGLRNGEQLLERLGGRTGDATTDYVWRVRGIDGRERVVSYKPVGSGTITVQRLELTPEAKANPSACARSLSGL
jgi:predicted metalloprotease with PDZ domain